MNNVSYENAKQKINSQEIEQLNSKIERTSSYTGKIVVALLWGRVVDKSVIYGIVIVIGGMQVYRMNKFWLLNDSSWVSTLLVPIAQTVLGAIIIILLIALPVRFFYPEFVKSYLLQKYTEEFRKENDMTEKEWYTD
ncbi:hypothetical protein HCB46_13185 [Listeria ivanovii]|uniref:hypothetical protein n=1 Tax=Listeria ivanovii TaxID=1638 RepID=UPI00162913ED|nr:hypothetical protein [Listeria ivanovii]MBC2256401.1 hypothetical protein [Listeria ivanovii]